MQKNAWCYDRLESSVCLDKMMVELKWRLFRESFSEEGKVSEFECREEQNSRDLMMEAEQNTGMKEVIEVRSCSREGGKGVWRYSSAIAGLQNKPVSA